MKNDPSISKDSDETFLADATNTHCYLADEEHGDERNDIKKLAQRETQHVRVWRRNVLLMIVAMAALVTTLTYIFLDREDEEDFQTSFSQFASTIQGSTEFNLGGIIEATEGLSDVFSSEAHKTNSTWPFMTLSSFEVFVRRTRAQASSELFVVCPIVQQEQIAEWNAYSQEQQSWIDDGFEANGEIRTDLNDIPSSIYRFGRYKGKKVLTPEDGSGPLPAAPFWQMSPPPFDTSVVNYNALSLVEYQEPYTAMVSSRSFVLGLAGANDLINYAVSQEAHEAMHSGAHNMRNDQDQVGMQGMDHTGMGLGEITSKIGQAFADKHPHTSLFFPIFESAQDHTSEVVAMIVSILPWDNYLTNLLPQGVDGVYAILQNSCRQQFTYVINGNDAVFVGAGDFHETKYDDMEIAIDFSDMMGASNGTTKGECRYWLSIFPSSGLHTTYQTKNPVIFSVVVASSFFLMALTFIIYDWFVIRKNNTIMNAAAQSNAIVSSLFPANVRDRLYKEEQERRDQANKRGRQDSFTDIFNEGLAGDDADGDELISSNPIADLFPDTTILFADIVGFTSWSSVRRPTDVFILLETLFRAFDKIAKRRRIFKVETIGDCYVAVSGLPEPRKDHAVAMCRFTIECLGKMQQLTKKLEETLGPDTGDLDMRFGLHSGPTTAGVLRGERSRFQLFGDTMNTAARMESNGLAGKIHMSSDTAELLVAAGKQHWVVPREDKIVAKGKGEMDTFWLTLSNRNSNSLGGTSHHTQTLTEDNNKSSMWGDDVPSGYNSIDTGTQRLVKWQVDVLYSFLERIATQRPPQNNRKALAKDDNFATGLGVLEEVQEIISMPAFAFETSKEKVALDPMVKSELSDFVYVIATMYRGNPFHNFEHASHVTMSVIKLLVQIVSPVDKEGGKEMAESLHAYTYGITSDPLTQFSCVLSALIHDVDHPGVPNTQLGIENPKLADYYKKKSVAEQNSVELAWNLLNDDRFENLRAAIYQTREEKKRFRQLVVNSVMATDIMDTDLKELRNKRWEKAFSTEDETESPKNQSDRKATIVIEHLIQASDVAHTMQHWHVYLKWNQCLFQEMYRAYVEGRAEKDPSEGWYQGELGFFDFYIIPLAKKLKECGVFGVSSAEYLDYAEKNRKEWEERGQEVVEELKKEVRGSSSIGTESTCDQTNIDDDFCSG